LDEKREDSTKRLGTTKVYSAKKKPGGWGGYPKISHKTTAKKGKGTKKKKRQ